MQDKTKKPFTVAVVGAGIAGLSCAKHLQEQGMRVQVFEKSRGVGGRMSTRKTESWQCDHGAQYFTARSSEFRDELKRWQAAGVAEQWLPQLRVIDGAQIQVKESRKSTQRYVGVPTMTAPARHIAKSLAVDLETHVDGLRRERGGWRLSVRSKGWQEGIFDALVLALPAPQALDLLKPTRSEFCAIVEAVKMRSAWALMMDFEDSFAPGFDAAFVNSGPIRWLARNLSKPQRQGGNVWLLHASAEWSDMHLEHEPALVKEALIEAFQSIHPAFPSASTLHRWRYADTKSSTGREYLWDSKNKLGLCGDWLNEAKVEGAWCSAIGLAKIMTHDSKINYLDIEIKEINFASLLYQSALDLRNEILRKPLGRSLDEADLDGEENQLHFGATSLDGELIACLSARKIDDKHYKIRQMAVSSDVQGSGVGARLVSYVERELLERGGTEISLHARESAIGFYEKLGFNCAGKLFDEVGIPHIKMCKKT